MGEGERVVTRAAAEELVEGDWDDVYVECSAKIGDNIGALFRRLVSLASNTSLGTQDLKLISVAKKGEKCKLARRKSFAIVSVSSLSKSFDKYLRRKSRSLDFEPDELSELGDKSSHNPHLKT